MVPRAGTVTGGQDGWAGLGKDALLELVAGVGLKEGVLLESGAIAGLAGSGVENCHGAEGVIFIRLY